MQTNHFKAILKNAARVLAILPFAAAVAFGQTPTINLAASPTTTTLPDGTVVPMWGYFCGAAVTGSTAACAALNPTSATTPTWSPVVITVPIASPGTATSLTINLTNNLSFPTTTAPNTIPTSIVILGQVGGGLGLSAQRTTTQSPDHTNAQGCATWFIADPSTPPGVPCAANVSGAFPPTQGQRVQSFSTEVAAAGATLVAPQVASGSALTWTNLRPGTYLLESGTHPSIQVPMGLIGMLVVTTAASSTTPGNAYPAVGSAPAVPYNAELPLEFSEIDPVQNKAVDQAVRTAGFSETTVWGKTTGDVVAVVTVTSGGTGYTSAPSVSITGGGGSGATASASLSFGVAAVAIASGGSGYLANQVLTFTDGDGTGATATVTSVGTGGVITGVTVCSPGSGYTVAPTTVTGGTGTGAVLTATLATTGSVGSVSVTNGGAGYTSTAAVSLTGGGGSGAIAVATVALPGCGIAHTCYPPAVNYTPFYYLINGVAFNKTNAPASVFAAYAGIPGAATAPVTTGITGAVLARLVNAGLRMHVPSIVGSLTNGFSGAGAAATVSGFTLIAEDGNPIPGVQVAGATTVPAAPRVQTHVFMAAGKTFDVMFNVPATATTPALPIYDRELSLSANSSTRDAGMLAYIGVNGSAPNGFNTTAGATQTGVFAPAMARPDTYNAVPVCVTGATSCTPLVVSDVSKGVIANDTNVYGVTLLTAPAGTLTCNAQTQNPVAGICENGTFTYTPNAGSTGDSFTYCANGTVTAGVCSSGITAMVNLGGSTLAGNPTAIAQTYTARTSTYIKIPSPGLLTGNSDPNNLTLTVVVPTTPPTGVVMDANGGFTASVSSGTSPLIFGYTVQNSQGRTATGTVTVNFPTPSNLQVTVVDAQAYSNCQGDSGCIGGLPPITDYRWIIEEDKTFWIDPNCTTNNSSTAPGCPAVVAAGGTVPTFGTNFHASHMGYVVKAARPC